MRHLGHAGDASTLLAFGPLVKVTVRAATPLAEELAAQGKPVLSEEVVLQVDTGAQCTCIDDTIPQKLGLVPHRFQQITGVSQQAEDRPVYRMEIGLDMSDDRTNRSVVGRLTADVVGIAVAPHPRPYVGLMGRDFLQYLRFVYEGPAARFMLQDYEAHRRFIEERDAKRQKKREDKKARKRRR